LNRYDSFNEGLVEVADAIPRLKKILKCIDLKTITEDETIIRLTNFVKNKSQASSESFIKITNNQVILDHIIFISWKKLKDGNWEFSVEKG
jgi:hypothetical protein